MPTASTVLTGVLVVPAVIVVRGVARACRGRAGHLGGETRPLTVEPRRSYLAEWRAVEATFPHDPSRALRQADDLLHQVLTERGYPVTVPEDRIARLPAEQASMLRWYRSIRAVALREPVADLTVDEVIDAVLDCIAMFMALVRRDRSARSAAPTVSVSDVATG